MTHTNPGTARKRRQLARTLLFAGLVLLALALGGLAWSVVRSLPARETSTAHISGAEMTPWSATATAAAYATSAAESTRTASTQVTPVGPSPTPTHTPPPPTPAEVTEASPTLTSTPTPAPTGETIHIVQPGENLFRIALEYGTTAEALAAANGIVNPTTIRVDQQLKIPSPESEPSPPPPTDTPTAVPPTPTATPTVPPTVTPTPTETPPPATPLPILTAQPTALSMRVIEAEWPRRMEVGRSDYIRISLVRTTRGEYVPTVEVAGHTLSAATPLPVGTPEVPIETAFGPEYRVSAVARLAGAAFEIDSFETEPQSLNRDRITWDWNIRPLEPGDQTISARVTLHWESTTGDTVDRHVWRQQLPITVRQPWLAMGQLNLLSLTSGLLGSALSAPWLYQLLTDRKEKRKGIPYPVFLQRQLEETRENLRLIQERKAQYVLGTDVPLQLIKDERRLMEQIAELEQQIEALKPYAGQTGEPEET